MILVNSIQGVQWKTLNPCYGDVCFVVWYTFSTGVWLFQVWPLYSPVPSYNWANLWGTKEVVFLWICWFKHQSMIVYVQIWSCLTSENGWRV